MFLGWGVGSLAVSAVLGFVYLQLFKRQSSKMMVCGGEHTRNAYLLAACRGIPALCGRSSCLEIASTALGVCIVQLQRLAVWRAS